MTDASDTHYGYITSQCQNLGQPPWEYRPRVKIRTDDGSTNWLSITEAELMAVVAVLLDRERPTDELT